jgi:hypothetical protein
LLSIMGHMLSGLELGLALLLRSLLNVGASIRIRGWVLHLGFITLDIVGHRHLIIRLAVILRNVDYTWLLLAAIAVHWLLLL